MKARSSVFLLIILSAAALTARAQLQWGEDRLIGNFQNGLTQVGPGFSHFDCLYGTDADVFVAFSEEGTTSSGDLLTVRKSFNNGVTWTYQKTVTGGENGLFSPNIAIIPGSNAVCVTTVAQLGAGGSALWSYKYDYDNLTYQGYHPPDYSYPGAGNPVSCTLVSNTFSGEVWLFTVDDNDWLYLTRSSDGETWTPSAPVAANVQRPHAEASADGHVAVVWSQTNTGDIKCAVAASDGTFLPAVTVTSDCCPMATPIAGWEHLGDMELGVVWHDNLGQSFLNISEDNGATWGVDLLLGNGYFPYIDHFGGTRRMGACITTDTGDVKVTSAASLSALPLSPFTIRSGHEAYLDGPAKVAFGQSSGQLALFYLSPTTQDFWFNSSVLTGIEEGQEVGHLSVTAGPSPAHGAIQVVSTGFQGQVELSLFSVDGRMVQSVSSATGTATLSTEDLPSGVYTVVAEDGLSMATCRVVRF